MRFRAFSGVKLSNEADGNAINTGKVIVLLSLPSISIIRSFLIDGESTVWTSEKSRSLETLKVGQESHVRTHLFHDGRAITENLHH
jgi:hypothetical protein